MDYVHHFKQRTEDDQVQDAALEFVEQELGRFDFQNNWEKAASRGNLDERIQSWLHRMGINLDPAAIRTCLEELHAKNSGRWL